ncbi:MAG: hypothetical protein WBD20_25630 [Pirellulaceae bacterium]
MKIRHFLRYPVDIARAKTMLADRCAETNSFDNRPLVLDLYTTDLLLDCGRHFAAIAHYAAQNQSAVVIRCRRVLLGAIAHKPFGGQMLEMANVRWVSEKTALPDNALVLTDVAKENASRDTGRASVVELLISKDVLEHCPVMPYPMHPGVLPHASDTTLGAARKTEGRRGIFFAGSQRAKYGREVLRQGFGVLNRIEILEFVRETFSSRVVTSAVESNVRMPVVLPARADSKAAPPISIQEWLPMLAKHQFFLCCPGIAQPMCHNVVESMSVGTIPIIEYPERFSPQLTDGVNAVCYQGRGGLREAIDRIDQMNDEEICQLSRNVMSHYDQHLDATQFMADLIHSSDERGVQQICLPFHDENLTGTRTFLQQQSRAA